MKKYIVKSVENFADHTVLTLLPENPDNRLHFWPGQYATISFRDSVRRSPMRCFSMVSSPNSSELQFAMRRNGQFTQKLADLKAGTKVRVQGPFGNFVIDNTYDRNIVMLAAGIGITPFMSMLRHAAESKFPLPITLIYACSSVDKIPFYQEIQSLQLSNPRLRVLFVVDQGNSTASANIYKGRIDDALLQKITGGKFQGLTFFMCGPKGFMQQMETILKDNNVTDQKIISESFTQTNKHAWSIGNFSIPSLTYTLSGAAFMAGFVFIMGLDLIRYTPKNTASVTTTTTNSTQTTTPSSTSSENSGNNTSSTSSTSSSDTSGNSSTSTTPTTSTTQTTTPTYYQQTYQAPVSSSS